MVSLCYCVPLFLCLSAFLKTFPGPAVDLHVASSLLLFQHINVTVSVEFPQIESFDTELVCNAKADVMFAN